MLSATPYIAMILFSLALTESRSISNEHNLTITEGVHSSLKRMAIQRKRRSSGNNVGKCNSAKTEYKDLTVMVQKMDLQSDINELGHLILNQVNGFKFYDFHKMSSLSTDFQFFSKKR